MLAEETWECSKCSIANSSELQNTGVFLILGCSSKDKSLCKTQWVFFLAWISDGVALSCLFFFFLKCESSPIYSSCNVCLVTAHCRSCVVASTLQTKLTALSWATQKRSRLQIPTSALISCEKLSPADQGWAEIAWQQRCL